MWVAKSATMEPTITVLPQTAGGELWVVRRSITSRPRCGVISTAPPSPKPGSGLPVTASIETSRRSWVGISTRSRSPSVQYATPRWWKPRFAGRPARQLSGSQAQRVSPLAASIAATWLSDVET